MQNIWESNQTNNKRMITNQTKNKQTKTNKQTNKQTKQNKNKNKTKQNKITTRRIFEMYIAKRESMTRSTVSQEDLKKNHRN